MRDLYITNSQGFAIVYSITSEGTFDELHKIYNQIMNIKVRNIFINLNKDNLLI
jgi:GTPase SAR1 family protein